MLSAQNIGVLRAQNWRNREIEVKLKLVIDFTSFTTSSKYYTRGCEVGEVGEVGSQVVRLQPGWPRLVEVVRLEVDEVPRLFFEVGMRLAEVLRL